MFALVAMLEGLTACGQVSRNDDDGEIFDRRTKRVSLSNLAEAGGWEGMPEVNLRRYSKMNGVELPLSRGERTEMFLFGTHKTKQGWVGRLEMTFAF